MTDKPKRRRRWKLCMWTVLGLMLVSELMVLLVGHFGWRQAIYKLTAVGLGAVLIGLFILLSRFLVHRRFQFRLKTLLIVVTAFCIGFGWLGVQIKRARDQRQAVEAIQEMGGAVYYHYMFNEDGYPVSNPKPPIPTWLAGWIGYHLFINPYEVQFYGEESGDNVLPVLQAFPDLRSLKNPSISDSALIHLKEFTNLRELELPYKITDAGLVHLKGMTNLDSLSLYGTNITDAGLAHLKGLTNLKYLEISSNQITNAGLEHLKELTNLQNLLLEGTQITDEYLENLKGLTNLQNLYLGNSQLSDDGLVHLEGLIKLRSLTLAGEHITDTGLEHLKGLINLKRLDLKNTKVTDEGVKKFQQALPNCEINYLTR